MFSATKAMLAVVVRAVQQRLRAAQVAQAAEHQRVLLALARRAATAATVRQLALLEALGARLLPARLLPALQQAVQVRLVELPLVPALPGVRTRSRGSRKSTASTAAPTARRSTSKRRRGR
jgi:anaerobic glycerol-3-phosphate dehydrogenase